MRRLLKSPILSVCAGLAVLIGAHWIPAPFVALGGDIPDEIGRIDAGKPDIVFIGNSYLDMAVEPKQLPRLAGLSGLSLMRGGSGTACWYLLIKNVLLPSRHVPRAVVLYFAGNQLTLPTYGTTDERRLTNLNPLSTADESLLAELAYRQSGSTAWGWSLVERAWPMAAQRGWIKRNSERELQRLTLSLFQKTGTRSVRKVFKRVFAERKMDPRLLGQRQHAEEKAQAAARDPYNFSAWIGRSFLPHLIRMARAKGSRLIVVRHRTRAHAAGVPDSERVKTYMAHLRSFLAKEEVGFIDFSQEARIELGHFDKGDHFVGSRSGFTALLLERLLPHLPPPAGQSPASAAPAG